MAAITAPPSTPPALALSKVTPPKVVPLGQDLELGKGERAGAQPECEREHCERADGGADRRNAQPSIVCKIKI